MLDRVNGRFASNEKFVCPWPADLYTAPPTVKRGHARVFAVFCVTCLGPTSALGNDDRAFRGVK